MFGTAFCMEQVMPQKFQAK